MAGVESAAAPPSTVGAPPSIVFVHVNVVPMDRERVALDQTVVIRGDRYPREALQRRIAELRSP
jgi:hypothetical protein